MKTVDYFKDKIGSLFFIVNYAGDQLKYNKNDEIPFTLVAIKNETLLLLKKRGSWEHREEFNNERLLEYSLVTFIK